MPTKAELEEEVARLEEALEQAHSLISEALGLDEESDDENDDAEGDEE